MSRRGVHVPGRLRDGSLCLLSSSDTSCALLDPGAVASAAASRRGRRRLRSGCSSWCRVKAPCGRWTRGKPGRGARDSLLLWLLARDARRGGEVGRGLRPRWGGERKPWDRLRLRLQVGDGLRSRGVGVLGCGAVGIRYGVWGACGGVGVGVQVQGCSDAHHRHLSFF